MAGEIKTVLQVHNVAPDTISRKPPATQAQIAGELREAAMGDGVVSAKECKILRGMKLNSPEALRALNGAFATSDVEPTSRAGLLKKLATRRAQIEGLLDRAHVVTMEQTGAMRGSMGGGMSGSLAKRGSVGLALRDGLISAAGGALLTAAGGGPAGAVKAVAGLAGAVGAAIGASRDSGSGKLRGSFSGKIEGIEVTRHDRQSVYLVGVCDTENIAAVHQKVLNNPSAFTDSERAAVSV